MNNGNIADIFKALAHPARLKIVYGLVNGEDCHVTKIVQNLKLPQPQISQHITVLKRLGIIEGIRTGNEICYNVTNEQARKIVLKIKELNYE